MGRLRVLRFLIAVLPVSLVLFWGAAYFFSVFSTTLAPGVPFAVTIPTPGGKLTLRGDSFNLRPGLGFYQLQKVRLIDPSGRLLASAGTVTITTPSLLLIKSGPIHVAAKGLWGKILRTKSGAFQIEKFIPETSKTSTQSAFDVTIENAEIDFEDLTGTKPYQAKAWIDSAKFAGSEGSLIGQVSATIANVGRTSATIQIVNKGPILVAADFPGIHVSQVPAPIVALLPSSVRSQVQAVAFRDATAKGHGKLTIPAKGPISGSFSGDIAASSIQWKGHRIDRAHWIGSITDTDAHGQLTAAVSGGNATWDAVASWSKGFTASGPYRLSSTRLGPLLTEVEVSIPADLAVTAPASTGVLAYSSQSGLLAHGSVTAKGATYQQFPIKDLDASYAFDGKNVRFNGAAHSTRLQPLTVSGTYAVSSRQLKLYASAQTIDLQALVERFAPKAKLGSLGRLKAPASAQAVLVGTPDRLKGTFRAHSDGTLTSPNLNGTTAVQGFDLVGTYQDGSLNFNRVWLKTDRGTAWASGTLALKSKAIQGKLDVRGLDLSILDPNLTGLASASGKITGTALSPEFEGPVEAYDAKYETEGIAAARADADLSLKSISLFRLQVQREASLIEGDLALDLQTDGLSGHLEGTNLRLPSFTSNDFEGAFNAAIPEVSGTLAHPQFAFHASGKDLLLENIAVGAATMSGTFANDVLTLDNAEADVDKGKLTASGHYSLKSKSGSATLASKNLDISNLLAEAVPDKRFEFGGIIDGTAAVDFTDQGVTKGEATGTATDASLNQSPLGQGPWSAGFDGKTLSLNAQTATQTSFLSLENGQVSGFGTPDGLHVKGTLLANQVSIAALTQGLAPLTSQLPPDARNAIAGVDGLVQMEADFDGPLNRPEALSVAVPELEVSSLNRSGTEFGSLKAAGQFSNGTYALDSASYSDGDASATVSGSLTPGKSISIDANVNQFDLTKLATFFPQSPALRGIASTSFVATGNPDHPKLRGSMIAQNIAYGDSKTLFGLNLDQITYDAGHINATGDLTYNGFVGKVTASAPFSFTQGIPDDQPLDAEVALADRPISDFRTFFPALANSDVDGTIGGNVAVKGPIGSLALTGHVEAKGSSLAFQMPKSMFATGGTGMEALKTHLTNFDAIANLADGKLTITGTGRSSAGGKAAVQALVGLDALDDLLNHPSEASTRSILSSSLTGTARLDRFAVSESNAAFATKGTIDGTIDLGGTLRRPLVSGELTASDVDSTIPALALSSGEGTRPLIDPEFSLKGSIKGLAKVRTGAAVLAMTGGGTLTGSLTEPAAHADLSVASGSFRLPGGKVQLQPGGTVTALYSSNAFGASVARLLVDIDGESHITSAVTPEQIQRYDVTIEIKGDLLDPNSVQILASSDPPDLTQAQILSSLGRTDILNAFGSGAAGSRTALQNVVAGYALPTLLEPFTNSLASALDLDYVNVEYSLLGQTSVILGKVIGGGFSLSLSRQISASLPGFPIYYDYRLNYRPAFLGRRFRSFSFLLGTDYQNPWKVGFQYSTRF